MNNNRKTPESWTEEVIGHAVMGRNYHLYRGISVVMTKIMASCTIVLLRHRFGTDFITMGTLFWCLMLLGIMYLVAGPGSAALFAIQAGLVAAASIWHILESRRNLRRRAMTEPRHSMDSGTSLLAWPFGWIIDRLRLGNVFPFRAMTVFGFQKWMEPGLLLLLALVCFALNCASFGFMLMLSASSLFRMALWVERDYYRMKQQAIDAGEYGQILETIQDAPRPTVANRVVSRAARRK